MHKPASSPPSEAFWSAHESPDRAEAGNTLVRLLHAGPQDHYLAAHEHPRTRGPRPGRAEGNDPAGDRPRVEGSAGRASAFATEHSSADVVAG